MSLSSVTAATAVMLPTGNHVNLMNPLILTEFVSIVTSEQSKVSICLCVCLCTAVGTCYVLDNHIPSTFDSGWFLLVNKLFKHWWCDESALYSHTGHNIINNTYQLALCGFHVLFHFRSPLYYHYLMKAINTRKESQTKRWAWRQDSTWCLPVDKGLQKKRHCVTFCL